MRKLLFTLAAVSLLALGANPASAMLIDNFNHGDGSVKATSGGSDHGIFGSYSGIVGNYREMELPGSQAVSGVGGIKMVANPSNSGYLTFSTDAMTQGSGLLTWDANGAGLGGVDMTDGGLSSFVSFDIISIDQGGLDLTITVEDQAGNTSSNTLTGNLIGTQQFDFLSFVGDTVDFTDIDSISLQITTVDDGSDLVLDQIFTGGKVSVPAPQATLALLAMGLLLIGFGVRRRVF